MPQGPPPAYHDAPGELVTILRDLADNRPASSQLSIRLTQAADLIDYYLVSKPKEGST